MRTCTKCQRTFPDDTDFCPRDGTALASPIDTTAAEPLPGLARRYRIVRPLGSGGMGTVFLAEQIAVGNRPVALKLLQRKLLDDPEFLSRFHVEASSTGRIRHPNVVTIYESGQEDDGTPYIAMEHLDGETLRQALQSRGAMSPAEAAEILRQAGRGLAAAHKLGIIHRDLKPDNIFLTRDDEGKLLVKVVDFGIAKLREAATHTVTGTFLGTPAYMSFEQAAGMRSSELDPRSDIYSLGIVAYEMLTGRVPFDSDTTLGFVRKHLTEPPPPFGSVKPDLTLSPQLESVVMKALEKDRSQRYASVLDFVREFVQAAKPGVEAAFLVQAGPASLPPPGWGSAAGPAREAAPSDLAVQTPPLTPPPTPVPEAVAARAEPPHKPATASGRTTSRFRAPRGPSVHLEKYDRLFSESAPAPRKRSRRRTLGLLFVIFAALWGLWHASRKRVQPPTVPPEVPKAAAPSAGSPTISPPQTPAQPPAMPDTSSAEQWKRLGEQLGQQMKDEGIQRAQQALAALGRTAGEPPKVLFVPPPPEHWDRPLKPGDKVGAEYIDGGLQLEASPVPRAVVTRAARGSKVTVQLDVESNGTVRKGRRLDGDNDVATALIQAAKQTWRFSPPLADGVPVRTTATVAVQF